MRQQSTDDDFEERVVRKGFGRGGEGVKVKIGGGGCWSGGRNDDNICALIVLLIKMTATLVYTKCSR